MPFAELNIDPCCNPGMSNCKLPHMLLVGDILVDVIVPIGFVDRPDACCCIIVEYPLDMDGAGDDTISELMEDVHSVDDSIFVDMTQQKSMGLSRSIVRWCADSDFAQQ